MSNYQPLRGSSRTIPSDARRLGDTAADVQVDITVVVRRPANPESDDPRAAINADPADLEAIGEFAAAHDLTVVSVDAPARAVVVSGTVAALSTAFQVELGDYRHGEQTFRGRTGDVHVPAALAPVIVAVLGLDDRPQATAKFWLAPHAGTSYTPRQIAQRYGFPTDVDGTGQTVAVIELGGGYAPADLHSYFTAQGVKPPTVTAVSVQGGQNSPGGDADGEVALDIEVIGAIAPGAAQAVYFAPNTTQGFYQAIAQALHDPQHKPSVVSISWGGPESGWTPQALDSYDALLADAATLGVVVYAAAGDNGSVDGSPDHTDQVDFPASSPHVLGCGGTTLGPTGETVWNKTTTGEGATGGGVSRHFPPPAYQRGVPVPANPDGKPGRGVPDVAGDADPTTGYQITIGGKPAVIGGTSAVAPLWAALTALANQANNGRAGAKADVFGALYGAPQAFTDITVGDNGTYHAGPGWDACTGLGTPHGAQVVQVLGTT